MMKDATTFLDGNLRVTVCLGFLLIFGAGLNSPAMAQAGSIAASVERSLARKLAQRGEAAVLTTAERAALAKIWRDLDQKTLVAIERRYGSFISTVTSGSRTCRRFTRKSSVSLA